MYTLTLYVVKYPGLKRNWAGLSDKHGHGQNSEVGKDYFKLNEG